MRRIMKLIDLNKLARDVALAEGKKEQVDLAQIKEIMKIIFVKLQRHNLPWKILEAIHRTWEKNNLEVD